MSTPVLLSILFGSGGLFLAGRCLPRKEEKHAGSWGHRFLAAAGLVFLAGLILRFWMALHTEGFTTDMDTFKAWAWHLNRGGFRNIYNREDFFVDYPPGYLYVLLLMDKLRAALDLSFNDPAYTLLLKLPSILADMVCSGCLLWVGVHKLGERQGLFLSALYLFCPVVLVNSAQWGQVDSFCTAILFASVLLLYREWYIPSALLYGISVACKPQMLIFAPLYLFWVIRQKKWIYLPIGVLCGLAAILVPAMPFTTGLHFGWLIDKYRSTMDYYSFYSINAYNFWTLIGWNWRGLPDGAALRAATLAAPVLASGLCGGLLLLSKRKDALFACPVLLMSVMYLFGIKMHERYLYPVFLFLLLCLCFVPDRRLLLSFGGASLANYLNVAHVLYLFREKGGNYDPNAALTRCLAGLQVLTMGLVFYALYAVYLRGSVREFSPPPEGRWVRETPADHDFHRADIIALAAVTLLYGVVAFWNLGDRKTALTSWAPASGDTVVLHAEESCDRLTYLPGIAPDDAHRGARTGANVLVETSEDGENWTVLTPLKDKGDYVFCWYHYQMDTPGRWVRLTALDGLAVLNEVALTPVGSETFAVITAEGTGAEALIDEQDAVPRYTTYRNSSYFDEIYHARTAYEHILKLEPYEYTHPPLGKYIIALGMLLFGVDPFGWRFMGALFGVLMLPALYFLLKQLFGRWEICLLGTVLLSADFMHYTQTRIATIDTYAVFFLLLMYGAMAVFLRRDLRTDSMKKLLLPLLAGGLFTGLGVASKWTAAYGAVGLAALYFGKLILTLWDAYRNGEDLRPLWKRVGILCAWCCLFFVAIPCGIYFLAYLPMCTLPHNAHDVLGTFFRYQTSMFNYHSQLVATHYFASPWYEWPFVIRPIWYFSGQPVDPQGRYSTISALGNILLWWSGIPALIAAVVLWVRRRKLYAAIVLCGFLSVYLPWVLVPRLTFIYHYFTAVPFLIIALCGVFSQLGHTPLGRQTVRLKKWEIPLSSVLMWVFAGGCLVLFAVYFPVISGKPADKTYTDALRLFSTWYF